MSVVNSLKKNPRLSTKKDVKTRKMINTVHLPFIVLDFSVIARFTSCKCKAHNRESLKIDSKTNLTEVYSITKKVQA